MVRLQCCLAGQYLKLKGHVPPAQVLFHGSFIYTPTLDSTPHTTLLKIAVIFLRLTITMPVFNLGLLGRFRISRETTAATNTLQQSPAHSPNPSRNSTSMPPQGCRDTSHVPVYESDPQPNVNEQLNQRCSTCSARLTALIPPEGVPETTEAVPPQPKTLEAQHCGPRQAHKQTCKTEQIRRYLIEIIALTVGAEFDEVNAAVYSGPMKGTNSILSESECKDLHLLSLCVRRVYRQMQRNGFSDINREDEVILRENIMGPADNLDYRMGGFALDLIGWYSTCSLLTLPLPWNDTILGHWAKQVNSSTIGADKEDFIYSMRSFKNAIKYVAPNEDVRTVLGDALEGCRRRCGLEPFERTIIYLPLRYEFYEMEEALYQRWKGSH
jgi:hypothetical protein